MKQIAQYRSQTMTIRLSIVHVLFSALAALLVSCLGPQKDPVSGNSVTHYSTSQPVGKTIQEIQQLTRAANAGSGEAAYMLSRYYSNEGRNVELAIHYEEIALSLNYSVALFRAAFREWASAPNPDIDRIEARALKAKELGAIELGVTQVQELLDEIALCRKTGVVPGRTKIRLVLPSTN